MSSTTIDQLFQITTPTRSARESSRPGPTAGDLFREHLNRAAEIPETKSPTTKSESKTATIEEDESLEPQTGQQETSTTEQEQAAATTESSDRNADATDEPLPAEEDPTDEVTLSAAAAQQAEPTVSSEQVGSSAAVAETSFADGQQQAGGQSSAELAETANDSASATGAEATELEATLLGEGGEGETANEKRESSVRAEDENDATKVALRPEAGQGATAVVVEGEVKKSQATAGSTTAQESLAKQQSASDAQEVLTESDTSKNSTSTETGRFQVPSTLTTNEVAVATDAELALANLNNTAETAIDTPSTSTSSTNSETVAAAGRTLGNLLAGKTAGTASANNETSATETPTVDRARFVQRVGGAIRAAQNRDGQIQLRLSPPELGTLRINIVMNEGVLTAHLETETAAARTVLLDNLPALRERLAEQEIRIEKFDVNVGREGQQQTDNPEADDRQTNNSRSQSNQPSTRVKAASSDTTESDPTQSVSASGLDVRV